MTQPDTFQRSMAHWSESGRAEMEAFYRVATQDYRELAEARDWKAWLQDRSPILDVACGSGKFPAALATYGGIGDEQRVLDLLDPSRFSIDEAARSLTPPFVPGRSFECRIQDLPEDEGPWRAVWATHALYAVPPAEMPAAMSRFTQAVQPGGGRGFIAHAFADSFYLAFQRAYLQGRQHGVGTPFSPAEVVIDGLKAAGVRPQVDEIRYVGRLESHETEAAQGFLQRCLFDESVSLREMLDDPGMGPLIRGPQAPDGGFRFPQHVALISWEA